MERRATVMLVEPDRTILEMLQIRFDVAGYNTVTARTGEIALETLKNFRPAALVMEANLPDQHAFLVLKASAPKEGRPIYPILLMTRGIGQDEIQQAAQLGVRACISKPFGGAEVLERVERLLRPPAKPPVVLNS